VIIRVPFDVIAPDAANADKVLIDDAGDGNAALPDAAHAILESGPVDAY
jgi:hypothetical protein